MNNPVKMPQVFIHRLSERAKIIQSDFDFCDLNTKPDLNNLLCCRSNLKHEIQAKAVGCVKFKK